MTYLVIFLISFTLTYLIKNYAIKKSLLASVNERSSHTIPTPHGGGVAIAIAWFGGLIYLYATSQIDPTLFYALMAGAVISAVGLVDDMVELKPKTRMTIFGFVATAGIFLLGGLKSITLGVFIVENPLITNIFALLLVLWYINLTNFIDGINGYAGSEFLFLSIAGFTIFGGAHFALFGASVLGFLYWNFGRAKIFMGDVGSTLLGYNVAIFTIYYANQNAQNLWIWVMLFGLFWFDATITLFRRWQNGEKLSQAHKKHAYQRLTQTGWSHYKVTNLSIMVNILIFSIVYFVKNIAVSFVLILLLLYGITKYIDKKREFT